MKKQKKRVPAFVYNDEYTYPDGFLVKDEDELDIKLKNGWNTGPVDNKGKKPEKKETKTKPIHHMKNKELVLLAQEKGIEVDPNWKRKDLIKAVKEG